MIEQAFLIGGSEIGEQHEAIPPGQQQQQLRERGENGPTRSSSDVTSAALRAAGIAGFAKTLARASCDCTTPTKPFSSSPIFVTSDLAKATSNRARA